MFVRVQPAKHLMRDARGTGVEALFNEIECSHPCKEHRKDTTAKITKINKTYINELRED